MKLRKRIIPVLLAAVLVLTAVSPAFAKQEPERAEIADKLRAFFTYVTPSGYSNGELCYMIDIPEGAHTMYGGSYNGEYYTPFYDPSLRLLSLSIGIWVYGSDFDPQTGEEVVWDDWDYPVCPDFYGVVDLADTNVRGVNNPHNNPTHISEFNLDNCERLELAELSHQHYCTEVSAVNCPRLRSIKIEDGAYRHIAVQPKEYEAPVELAAIGAGVVGLNFSYNPDAQISNLTAAPAEGTEFLGWYLGGECISTALHYAFEGAGKLYACFGGDADGSGSITVVDAILTLRAAMGIIEFDADVDANMNGGTDVADAILLLRVVMGI